MPHMIYTFCGRKLQKCIIAPFHVCEVFDDVEDLVLFTNMLLSYVVNHHAPVQLKMTKKESPSYEFQT